MQKEHLIIPTARLTLRPFTALDADEVYTCITPTLTRFMSWEPSKTRQEFDHVWQQWLIHIEQKKELIYVIRQSQNKEFIGLIGLHHIQTNTPEIGIWIREDRHGLGFGGEAVHCLVMWASKDLQIQHFIYPVAVENTASRKIAESVGGVAQYIEKKPKYEAVTYFIPPQANSNTFLYSDMSENIDKTPCKANQLKNDAS